MANLLTGARVVCYINGTEYAVVTGAGWQVSYQRKAIYGLDSPTAYEIAPTTVSVTGTLRVLRSVLDGGAEGYGYVAFPKDIYLEQYVTINLIDRRSDSVLFSANRCSILSQSWEVPSKGLVQGSITFQAIDWSSEAA